MDRDSIIARLIDVYRPEPFFRGCKKCSLTSRHSATKGAEAQNAVDAEGDEKKKAKLIASLLKKGVL